MKAKIGKEAYSVYCYDIESHNDEGSIARGETGVWLSCLIDETSTVEDPETFLPDVPALLARLECMTAPRKGPRGGKRKPVNVCVFVWNLAHEWKFILPELLSEGFSFRHDMDETEEEGRFFESVSTKTCSSVWRADLRFGKEYGRIVFRDLMKMFSGSLRAVAKSFGLKTQKGEIDYRKDRTAPGYQPTQEEKEYNFKDVRIMVEILQKMEGDREFWNTISAASFSCAKMLKETYPGMREKIKGYRERFPILGDAEEEFVRRSYQGGLCYANPEWQFVEIDAPIKHIDYHQSYPSAIASVHAEIFPYGFGKYFQGKPSRHLGTVSCCHVRVWFDFPIYHEQIKTIGMPCASGLELWVWDFELLTMAKAYKGFRVVYLDGYEYRASPLPFRKYVLENYEKRLKAIAEGNSFLKAYYKLLNNSFYGKIAERAHESYFENVIREDGTIDSEVRACAKRPGKYSYIPVASCITAYRRCALIEDALRLSPSGDSVLYMDTDSLFFLDNEETREGIKSLTIGEALGDFAFEADIERGQFTAAKRYKIVEKDVGTTVKAGGITMRDGLDFDDVDLVEGTFTAKTAVRAKGGALIIDKVKELGVQAKYRETFDRNKGRVYNEKADG